MSGNKVSPVVIISGGTGYVGSAIAQKLSQDGFRAVLLHHDSDGKKADAIISGLGGSGHRAYQCDLANSKEVVTTIKQVIDDCGEINACIHTAESKLERSLLSNLSIEKFRQQFEVGVFGGFIFLSEVARLMNDGGVIIGITSAAIEPNMPAGKMGAYLPAKYALKGMLRVLSSELSTREIRVHAVAPNFLPGGLNSDLPIEVAQLIFKKTNSKSTVVDIAAVVAFLCSPDAKNLNGLSLPVTFSGPNLL